MSAAQIAEAQAWGTPALQALLSAQDDDGDA
jgi:hypothetical protein